MLSSLNAQNGKSIPIFAPEINEPQVNDFPRYLDNGVNTNTFNSVASHTCTHGDCYTFLTL